MSSEDQGIAFYRLGKYMTSRPPPTVIVAPTAFKGTMGPTAVARAMAAGVAAAWPAAQVIRCPLSDGGNGLLEVWADQHGGVLESLEVSGPLSEKTPARYLRSDAVVVESAEACGLHLIRSDRRDPLRATTRGVGELLRVAAEHNAPSVVLGLGGSGTVDGGTGMARALGWRFLDRAGRDLDDGGASLVDLVSVHAPSVNPLAGRVVALADVANPLAGRSGAARVYGPQKGAGPEAVELLDEGLGRLADILEADLGLSVADLPGAGAAGGLGAGAVAFLGAELVAGAEWMIDRAGLRELVSRADVLITGEGRFDSQSGMGKLTGKVLDVARTARLPVLLVCGKVDGRLPAGVVAVDEGGRTLDEADVARLTEAACRSLAQGDKLGGR